MFDSSIIDVAIGLAFIYLLLSFAGVAIAEGIEAFLKLRAGDLKRGIAELLHGNTGLVDSLYRHPLIWSLYSGGYDPQKTKNLPSYIPSRTFALALMDLVLPGNTATSSGAAGAIPAPPVAGAAPTQLPNLGPLKSALPNLANADVERALRTLLDAAGDNASQARQNIEDWFDASMDRVSGWYKRRVQLMLLVIGVLLAVAVNADTVTIANSLSHDTALRQSLVNAAQEYARTDTATDQQAAGDPASPFEACRISASSPECRVARNLEDIRQLGLPVGWNPDDVRTLPDNVRDWGIKVIGWLLTGVAVSLGAPFWFDVLNKFIVVRATVKPKEKSPEEKPIG